MKLNINYLLITVILLISTQSHSEGRKIKGKSETFLSLDGSSVLLLSSGEPVYGSTERKVACSHLIQSKSLVWVHALKCETSLQNLSMILRKQHAESTLEMIENSPSSSSYGIGNEHPNHSELKNNIIQPFLPAPLLE